MFFHSRNRKKRKRKRRSVAQLLIPFMLRKYQEIRLPRICISKEITQDIHFKEFFHHNHHEHEEDDQGADIREHDADELFLS